MTRVDRGRLHASALDELAFAIADARGIDARGLPQFTSADVLAMLDEWTAVLAAAEEAIARRWLPRWAQLVDDATAIAAQRSLDARYPNAAHVVAMLGQLAEDLDRERERAELRAGFHAGWRNATVSANGDVVDVDGVKDWTDLWGALWRHYRDARGTVSFPNPHPTPHDLASCPNTTIGDVRWLISFWETHLHDLGDRRVDGTDAAIVAWHATTAHVTAITQGLPDTTAYAENWAFWNALASFVVALDLARENAVPTGWRLYLGAAEYAAGATVDWAKGAGQTVAHGVEAAASTVADVASAAASTVAETASDAVHGLEHVAGAFTTPLIIGAAVLGSVVLISLARK